MKVASSPVWEKRCLREVVTKLVDGSHNPPPKQDTGLPMLSARNVDHGQVLFDDYRLISESAFASENARTRIAPGDVLLTIVGTIGRTAVVAEGSQPFSLQRSVAVLTPSANLLPKFLCYQLESPAIQKHFEANARGTAQKGVYLKTLGQTPIVLPPVDVQREIVAELEKQFSRLDEAVANLQRVKANLKRYKASVLKAAVEGRLVESEATLARREGRTYETGEQLLRRILEERRRSWKGRGKYANPIAAAGIVDFPLPEGWSSSTLESVTDSNRVICYGILMPKDNVDDGVLFVKVRDMRGDSIDLNALHKTSHEIAAKYARASLKTGDVLLSIRGTFGRVAVVPPLLDGGNITQDTARIAVSRECNPEFVAVFLRSEDAQRYFKRVARGVAVKGVNIGDVRPMPILIPPLTEQNRIVAEVDRHLSIVREVEAEVDANLQRAQALRRSILQSAFEGK